MAHLLSAALTRTLACMARSSCADRVARAGWSCMARPSPIRQLSPEQQLSPERQLGHGPLVVQPALTAVGRGSSTCIG
eukprot:365414-Chlamydomonas_euryale.AAC.2